MYSTTASIAEVDEAVFPLFFFHSYNKPINDCNNDKG
ncbi:hypothetical protein EV145_10748 [Flavobacterium sp. 245]|nr:hypothetical protein EV145_10748 [Flavobacterium sp. 245]